MAYADNSSFKIYLADTGILCSKFGISPNIIMEMPHAFDQFKGALIENYVMQGLIVNEISPFYWNPDNRSEVDFVFQNRLGQVIPIEVKSSDNVRSRSLSNYCARYGPPYAIRLSPKNFGFENNIKSLPLYAALLPGRSGAEAAARVRAGPRALLSARLLRAHDYMHTCVNY